MLRILHIDDDILYLEKIATLLKGQYHIHSISKSKNMDATIAKISPNIVILNIHTAGINGYDIIRHINYAYSSILVIVLSKIKSLSPVVRAIKFGAYDCINKFDPFESLRRSLKKASKYFNYGIKSKNDDIGKGLIVGNSRCMQRLRDFIAQSAPTSAPILLTGDSGVGKGAAAKVIHQHSLRSKKRFLGVNCSAIPTTLFESEVFGTESGAYTDSIQKPGYFEQATAGTLFLDEIGELPKETQVKLLRILEERSLVRLGGRQSVPIDVRIITATNRNFRTMLLDSSFRLELFHRIAVLPFNIEPLKERVEDIAVLATTFLNQLEDVRRDISVNALHKLYQHSWPGNIRELHNCLYRAAVLCDGKSIQAKDITFII